LGVFIHHARTGRGLLNPLAVGTGAEVGRLLPVADFRLGYGHQADVTNPSLLTPGRRGSVNDDLPRRQGGASHTLHGVDVLYRAQLEEAAGVDQGKPGGVFKLLANTEKVLVRDGFGYFGVATVAQVGFDRHSGVLRVEAADVRLYGLVGPADLGSQDARVYRVHRVPELRHVEPLVEAHVVAHGVEVAVVDFKNGPTLQGESMGTSEREGRGRAEAAGAGGAQQIVHPGAPRLYRDLARQEAGNIAHAAVGERAGHGGVVVGALGRLWVRPCRRGWSATAAPGGSPGRGSHELSSSPARCRRRRACLARS
jgi:hypothetical protein